MNPFICRTCKKSFNHGNIRTHPCKVNFSIEDQKLVGYDFFNFHAFWGRLTDEQKIAINGCNRHVRVVRTLAMRGGDPIKVREYASSATHLMCKAFPILKDRSEWP